MRRSGGQGDQVMHLQPAELHELPIADAGGQPQAQRGLEMPTAEVSLGTIDTPKAVVWGLPGHPSFPFSDQDVIRSFTLRAASMPACIAPS
jgi:hypothetical protein